MSKGKTRATRDEPITDLGLVVRRFFSTMLLSRCPNCGKGRIGKNFFVIKGECPVCHAVFNRSNEGTWMASATINYFFTAVILTLITILLVRSYGFFPGLTWYIAALAVVVGGLIYRPCKLLAVWLLWVFGFIYS